MISLPRTRHCRTAASLVLAGVLLALFLRRAPLAEVGEVMATIQPGWLAGAVVLALLSYVLRGLRWGLILQPVGTAPAVTLVGSTAAGFAASTLLPARAGEVVRGLVIAARTGMPAAGTLASILTERLVDLATVLALFAGAAALAGGRVSTDAMAILTPVAVVAGAVLATGLGVAWLVLRHRERAINRLTRVAPSRFRGKMGGILHHAMDGLEILRRPGSWWLLAAWSALLWLTSAAQLILLARGFGIQLDLVQGVLVMSVSIVGLSVPTPGAVGGFHAAIQFALINMLGVGAALSSAFAILHHAVCFVPITLVGLVYLSRVGFSFKRIPVEKAEADPQSVLSSRAGS